jgi:predicted transcriptional regulator
MDLIVERGSRSFSVVKPEIPMLPLRAISSQASVALAIILLLSPIGAALGLEEDPVSVEIEAAPAPHCSLAVDPEVCLATWDSGDDPQSMSDDQINVTRFVSRAKVSIGSSEAGFHREAAFSASEFAVEHPANHVLNETWIFANDSLPGEFREYVTLESRAMNTAGENPPRGVLVVMHFPTPVPDPIDGTTLTWASAPLYSWDCSWYFTSQAGGDKVCSYDELRPLPSGVRYVSSTDGDWDYLSSNLTCSSLDLHYVPHPYCVATDVVQAEAESTGEAWKEATPSIAVGTSVEKVAVEIKPDRNERDRGAFAEAASSRSRTGHSFPMPSQPHSLTLPTEPIPPQQSDALDEDSPGSLSADNGGVTAASVLSGKPLASGRSWVPFVAAALTAGSTLFILALALYHRLVKTRTLDNANRVRIYETIKAEPGIRAGTLQERVGLSYATVLWHLRVLEEFHLVEGQGEGQRRYFLNGGSFTAKEKAEIMAVSAPAARAVFEHVRARGEVPLASIPNALGISLPTVSQVAARLEHAGLVSKRRANGRIWVKLGRAPIESALPP